MNHKDQSAFSLVEIVVTMGLVGIGSLALMNLNQNFMDSNKSNTIRLEAADIKRTMTNMLSCEQTFSSFGSARPIVCSGNITLRNKLGQPLFANDKVGNWSVEGVCENVGNPPNNGLSIYITQQKPDGTFKQDPLRKIPLDRSHPVSSLYLPETRPCNDYFQNSSNILGCRNVAFVNGFQLAQMYGWPTTQRCPPGGRFISSYVISNAATTTLGANTITGFAPVGNICCLDN